ncbi:MAG: hypothetical protein ACKOI3_05340 [Actinomycetota bacterium]
MSPSASQAASIEGKTCNELGQIRRTSAGLFRCAATANRRTWRRIAAPTATTTATTTTTATISDSLSFKNPMIYGVKDARLTRKADSGTYFETDSRKPEAVPAIRQKAYAELNPPSLTFSHPNIEFIYDIRPSFPTVLIDYTKRELSGAAALWNDFFLPGTRVRVSLVTEKDREYIKNDQWLQLNLPAMFDRFDGKKEQPFITGGGGYWDRDGDWTGNIYLGTASYLDLTYISYQWPQVARHEFFHVVQDYAMFKNRRARPSSQSAYNKLQPLHFREGGASIVGHLTSFRNSGWSSDALNWYLWSRRRCCGDGWISVQTTDDAVRMMIATEEREPSQAFEMSYPLGAAMYEWLIATYGLDGFKKLLNQLATAPSFDVALQNSVGLTQSEFYAKCAPYVLTAFRNTDP